EHLLAILGMNEDAVALLDAARGQRRRERGHLIVDLAPGPGFLAPDEADAVAMAARILGQHISEVHDPARHAQGRHRAGLAAHFRPMKMPAAISTRPTTPEAMPCLT